MIMRAMGMGFVLWLANAAIFRFAGDYFFLPGVAPPFILAIVVAFLGALITFAVLKFMREAPGDECEAAVSLAFPSLLLNALLVHEFGQLFPNLDSALDGVFGALAMIYGATMVFTGLLMTRIAPQDERV
jgi:Family of unknown function (DUF5367)